MAITSLYKLDKVILAGPVPINNIKSHRWVAGISDLLENPAGHTFPMFTATQQQRPMVEFETTELGQALSAIALGGTALGSTTTWFKLATTTGSVARATTSHSKITITSCLAYWKDIRLSHNQAGTISVSLMANYDGANDPFIYAGSTALSGNLAAGNWFGAGPVSINGVSVPGIKEISVSNEVKLIQEGGESEEFDTFIGVEECRTSVTIKTKTLTNWATVLLRGLALDGANGLIFYAREFSPNASRVANATATHIKFQGLLGTAKPIDTSGEGSSTLTDTIKITLVATSDSVNPLLVTVNSAIT